MGPRFLFGTYYIIVTVRFVGKCIFSTGYFSMLWSIQYLTVSASDKGPGQPSHKVNEAEFTTLCVELISSSLNT